MLIRLPEVLNAEQLVVVRRRLAEGEFVEAFFTIIELRLSVAKMFAEFGIVVRKSIYR